MKKLSLILQTVAIFWLSAGWSTAGVVFINAYQFTTGATPAADGDPYFNQVVLSLHCDGANGSTTFVDSSNSAKTITAAGNAQITTTNPKFGTGAMLLDGTGDYAVTAASSTDFSFGTSVDFTLECWAYLEGSSDAYFFGTSDRSLYFGLFTGSIILGNGSTNPMIYAVNYATYRNKWTHVAVTRVGTTLRVFLDGEVKQTVTSSASFGANAAMNVGREPNNSNYIGRIDGARITKGVARYTADFTPPTQASPDFLDESVDPYWGSVSALLPMQGVNNGTTFTDVSGNALVVTALGNAKTITSDFKWGTSCALFDGSGDLLTIAASPVMDFGAGNYTVEMQIKWNTVSGAQTLIDFGNGATALRIDNGNTLYFFDSGAFVINAAAITPLSADVWYHIALVRNGTTRTVYVNGVAAASGNRAGTAGSAAVTTKVGARNDTGLAFNGKMQYLRITKGFARYTSNFTPPTRAFATP